MELFFNKKGCFADQKRRIFLATTLVMLCLFFSNTALLAGHVVMKSPANKVSFWTNEDEDIDISIDWGDGTKSNINDGKKTEYRLLEFSHQYADKRPHTIVIVSEYIKHMTCNYQQLIALELNNCQKLESLSCTNNQLTSLDISNCPLLKKLRCHDNKLESLDAGNCPRLTQLSCSYNQLASLNIIHCRELAELYCGYNQLMDLDISNCQNLALLSCMSNKLTSLDIDHCRELIVLECDNNQLTSLSVSHCHELFNLSCSKNQLRNLDISNCLKLSTLSCGDNLLISLDVSNCKELNNFDASNCNVLSTLNISNCTEIRIFNASNCIALRTLDINHCEALSILDVSGCASLEKLNWSRYDLGSRLKTKGCPRLQFQFPNPEGTITVNVRNSSNGNTIVTPVGFNHGFYIGSDNNFRSNSSTYHAGYTYRFLKVGKVRDLTEVMTKGGSKGWTDFVAVTPGHGYIAEYSYKIERNGSTAWKTRYVRIYVVREILEAAEHQAVLGAEIEYIVDED
jgi:Leucine-rich repeat (LRR) protein